MAWHQGEHLAIVGDTGSGKTYLEARALQLRGAVIVLRTKPDDIAFPGFTTIRSVRDIGSRGGVKYLLAPRYEHQRRECKSALDMVWKAGSWCIAIDELYYAIDQLKLEPEINRLLTQGRSKYLTVVCGMQRPVLVSRFALSQSKHVISFHVEPRDAKTLAEATTERIRSVTQELKRYEFVYFNRSTRELRTGTAQQIDRILGSV